MNLVSFVRLMRMIHGHRPPDLAWIQDQGLLAVKISQHYALRVDFLDEAVCRELARLFRDARPAAGAGLAGLLAGSVPPGWREHFRTLEDEPFAVASVGQVHRGTLVDGRAVVVKLLKADHARAFLADLAALRRLLGLALKLMPRLERVFDPRAVLDHIHDYTLAELDLRNELAGTAALAAVADAWRGRRDLGRLRLPTHLPELSGPRVLVTEFVPGRTVDEHLAAGTFAYEDLLALFDLHGTFLFGAGTFHGDLHPGNVIVDPAGRFCLVDTGAISRSPGRIRRGLFDFFVGLARHDLGACDAALVAMAARPPTREAVRRLAGRVHALYRGFFGRTVAEVSLTKQMMRTIRAAVESGLTFDRGMFPVIKSLMYLDGMVLRCRPDAVLIDDMRPFIDGFAAIRESGG